jgi:predicted transcriptional regulator
MKPTLPELSEIKRRRERMGLTQSALAEKARVSQSLVAKVENGEAQPSYANARALFAALDEAERGEEKKARDLMNNKVLNVSPTNSVGKAMALMKKHGISQIPVVKDGIAVGSVSEKMVLQELEKGRDLHELAGTKISEAMEEPFPTISEETPLSSVSALLAHEQAVLVSKKGRTTGIITKGDLIGMVK